MNQSPPDDLFSNRPVRSDYGRGPSYRMRRILTVSVVVVVLAGGLHFIFSGGSLLHSGEIATIKAEGGWKQRPDQPGGLDIPNQNVQVYQALDNKDDSKTPVEHLLPPPETPQPVAPSSTPNTQTPASSALTAPQIESLTPPKLDIDNIPMTVVASPSAAPPLSPPPATNPETATMAPPPNAAPVATIVPAKPIAPVGVPAPTIKITGVNPPVVRNSSANPKTIAQVLKDVQSAPKAGRIVQLASVQDQATAQSMAEKFQIRYAAILGSAHLRPVQADITGKGVFYRIQSQPMTDDRASSICDELKKMKAGCILVRP